MRGISDFWSCGPQTFGEVGDIPRIFNLCTVGRGQYWPGGSSTTKKLAELAFFSPISYNATNKSRWSNYVLLCSFTPWQRNCSARAIAVWGQVKGNAKRHWGNKAIVNDEAHGLHAHFQSRKCCEIHIALKRLSVCKFLMVFWQRFSLLLLSKGLSTPIGAGRSFLLIYRFLTAVWGPQFLFYLQIVSFIQKSFKNLLTVWGSYAIINKLSHGEAMANQNSCLFEKLASKKSSWQNLLSLLNYQSRWWTRSDGRTLKTEYWLTDVRVKSPLWWWDRVTSRQRSKKIKASIFKSQAAFQNNSILESLILAQDERWRRA